MTDALSNLFEAVQTALLNMETAMDLPSHPEKLLVLWVWVEARIYACCSGTLS